MKVVFSAISRRQIHEIATSYSRKRRKLGVDFIESLSGAVHLIQAFPRIGAKADDGYRKFVLRRFPYVMIYSIKEDRARLRISAVSHQRRDPDRWHHHVEDPAEIYAVSLAA